MGKPDPITIGSIFFIVTFITSTKSLVFTLICIFSSPSCSNIFCINSYIKNRKVRLHNYLSFVFSYILYYFYTLNLDQLESRFSIILEDKRGLLLFSTTSFRFFIVIYVVVIPTLKRYLQEKRIHHRFHFIYIFIFFTIEDTRIFVLSSVPLIIYLFKNQDFQKSL